jgi:glycosyltransferase involved in cell wall biosynthesis
MLNKSNWLRPFEKILMRFATTYYTQAAVSALRDRFVRSDDLVLVFPSIDGLGLHFLKRCLRKKIPIKQVVIRTLQAEGRGMFATPNLIQSVEDLILVSPDLDVRIGFEVNRVGNILKSSSKSISQILWSPIPNTKSASWGNLEKSELIARIGFLGAARKLKGFENVPRIIKSIASSGRRFEFYVQLAAEEWNGYKDILEEFRNSEIEITFLEGGCSDELLLKTISILDCLVLPYRVEEYKFAGSGLLFHAADFGVPVISMRGVGFEWDIQEFSIGVLCNTYEEIPGLLQSLDTNHYKKSISEYNLARNEATIDLLNFGKKSS